MTDATSSRRLRVEPDGPLAQLIHDALCALSLSYEEAARRICRAAAEEGATTSCDRYSIRNWLSGTVPRPESLRWIARALQIPLLDAVAAAGLRRAATSSRGTFGSLVAGVAQGFTAAPGTQIVSVRCVAGSGDSLDLVVELEDSDMDRRTALRLTGFEPGRRRARRPEKRGTAGARTRRRAPVDGSRSNA